MQHAGHGCRTGRQSRSAEQHVADPLAAPFGMGLLEHQDRAFGELRQPAPLRPTPVLVQQTGRSQLLESLLPGEQRALGDADEAAKSPAGRPLRCQVSNNSTRCSGVVEIERDSARFRRGPPRRLATRFGGNAGAASSDTASLGASPNASASISSFSADSSPGDAPAAKPPRRPGPRSPSAGRAAGEDSLRPGLSESSPASQDSSPCPRCFTGSNIASSLFWRRPFLYLFKLSNRQTFR